jgi:beta-galactosidase
VRIGGAPEDVVAGRIDVANHQHFSDLGWLRARYSLTVDGVETAGDAFDLPAVGPGGHASVDLPSWITPDPDSGEAFLTVHVTTAEEQAWASAGFEVCAVQLQVGRTDGPGPAPADAATGGSVDIDGDGRLRHPLLATPPTLSLWRAPTDNDRIGGFAARWESQGVDRLERRPGSVERDGASTTVRDTFRAGSIEIAHEATYTCRADGAIEVVETVDIPDALVDLARVGTVMEVAAGPESLRWFGTGPHETYPDRKRSGLVGRWESTVADQYVPYIRPQENGGHADVRWLELRDGAGAALRIVLDQPRQVSVTHHRAQDLATATHDIDVVAVPETVIHIDAAHRGLGTASCGPDTTPEYLLGAGRYTWAWTLRDLAPA